MSHDHKSHAQTVTALKGVIRVCNSLVIIHQNPDAVKDQDGMDEQMLAVGKFASKSDAKGRGFKDTETCHAWLNAKAQQAAKFADADTSHDDHIVHCKMKYLASIAREAAGAIVNAQAAMRAFKAAIKV